MKRLLVIMDPFLFGVIFIVSALTIRQPATATVTYSSPGFIPDFKVEYFGINTLMQYPSYSVGLIIILVLSMLGLLFSMQMLAISRKKKQDAELTACNQNLGAFEGE